MHKTNTNAYEHHLVTRFISNDDEHGPVASFNAVFYQSSDAFVDFLPHFPSILILISEAGREVCKWGLVWLRRK